jgi:methylglyoxal synthase
MLAIDEKKDDDTEFTFGNVTVLANEELLKATGTITVDANDYGFQVASENPMGGGGCDCNSGCSCGC